MSSDVEIDNNMAKVAPYAGSISLVKFKTQKGNNITYRIILSNKKLVPFGSDIYDENNNKVGLVGQGGLVHFNAADEKGLVFIKWGNANDQRCKFSYKTINNKEIPETTCYLY